MLTENIGKRPISVDKNLSVKKTENEWEKLPLNDPYRLWREKKEKSEKKENEMKTMKNKLKILENNEEYKIKVITTKNKIGYKTFENKILAEIWINDNQFKIKEVIMEDITPAIDWIKKLGISNKDLQWFLEILEGFYDYLRPNKITKTNIITKMLHIKKDNPTIFNQLIQNLKDEYYDDAANIMNLKGKHGVFSSS